MRRGPVDSGWVGSLFDEPIDQVKAPSDRCICHQDCPQYETCETEALDKSSKVYYLLRCVKGKFPACTNCMCMACDRFHECKDGETDLRGGVRYRMCNRPISITGCLDYSGSIPWRAEAYCKECDHICDLRKELIWAPRVRCDPKATVALVPVEPMKPVDPETETIADLAKRLTQIAERDGEKILEKLYGVTGEMTAAEAVEAIKAANSELTGDNVAMFLKNIGHTGTRAQRRTAAVAIMREVGNWAEWHRAPVLKPEPDVVAVPEKSDLAVDLERWEPVETTKQWMLSNCGKHHSCRDDCAGRRSGALCPFVISRSFLKDCVRQGDMPADLLDDRAKDDAEAKVARLTKAKKPELAQESPKPAKAKKQPKAARHNDNYCVLRGGDCSVHNGCQNGDVPCTLKDVPHLEEIHLPCEIHALLDLAVKPAKEPMALLLNGKWYSDGKMLWDCSDCLCLACANEGKSCHDCKGFERCLKIGGTGGKIGACPDFRTEEGKEQHCLENGCLCFKCQFIGEQCEECPGPIRCAKPRMKCKEYIGAEVEA